VKTPIAALLALATAAAIALGPRPARADALTAAESLRLARGETVVRKQSLEQGSRRYVGGVAYAVVDAPADDLSARLASVDAWRHILPRTRSARWVGSAAGDHLVEMTHGTPLLGATYTLRVRREGRGLRFWLDADRPHDIEDAWGFLRAEDAPGGRTLIVYGILIDMGPGMLRDLFEERVRDAALTVPDRVRGWVFERSARGQRASR
jgi:hypothetical protein